MQHAHSGAGALTLGPPRQIRRVPRTRRTVMRAAVAALPERQRFVVFLRHYADLSYEQIAETLEIERGTVAATLHAAHAALRKTIKEVPR